MRWVSLQRLTVYALFLLLFLFLFFLVNNISDINIGGVPMCEDFKSDDSMVGFKSTSPAFPQLRLSGRLLSLLTNIQNFYR